MLYILEMGSGRWMRNGYDIEWCRCPFFKQKNKKLEQNINLMKLLLKQKKNKLVK